MVNRASKTPTAGGKRCGAAAGRRRCLVKTPSETATAYIGVWIALKKCLPDGPLSSDGAEEEVNDNSTDDDEDSISTEDGQEEGHGDIRDTQNPYLGYFERQRAAKCGMHALNNAIGRYQG